MSCRHIVVVHAYNPWNLSECCEALQDLAMAVTMFVVACTESSQAVLINALSSQAVIGVGPIVPKSGFRLC